MDKSGIFVGATVGSISVFIIFTALFMIPVQSDETTLQMQNQIDEINNLILIESESKTLSLIEIFEKQNQELLESIHKEIKQRVKQEELDQVLYLTKKDI